MICGLSWFLIALVIKSNYLRLIFEKFMDIWEDFLFNKFQLNGTLTIIKASNIGDRKLHFKNPFFKLNYSNYSKLNIKGRKLWIDIPRLKRCLRLCLFFFKWTFFIKNWLSSIVLETWTITDAHGGGLREQIIQFKNVFLEIYLQKLCVSI